MKKLLFIVFLFAFTNGISFSQDIFSLDNAKWTGADISDYYWPDVRYTYFSFVIFGDTIVDDIHRSKLYYIPDINKTDSILAGYFHVIDKKVFYRQHNFIRHGLCDVFESDYLLFDFSLQKDDTYYYPCNFGLSSIKVTDILQVEFGGYSRKKIIFDNTMYWIEGMGGFNGFFEGHEPIPTSEENRVDYICFSVNDEVLYLNPNYLECPTPQFNSIHEKEYIQLLKKMQIYNVSGILVCEYICNDKLHAVIPEQSLSSGIYLVKRTLQNGDIQTTKIIIQ